MGLILASGSSIRQEMLEAAGVSFTVERPDVDEAAIKAAHQGDMAELPSLLATAKAQVVSAERPGDWVIGSDSMVFCDGRAFDKPKDRNAAADHLRFFSGKSLILASSVTLVHNGKVDWAAADQAILYVRPLSDAFIADYLDREWPQVSYCVGVFRMEGPGVTLFDRVEGSHFTILGMPLLPLLGALRSRGLMLT